MPDAKWYVDWIRSTPSSTPAEKLRNLEAAEMMERLEADREALLKIAHDYAGCSECIHVDNKPELPPCSSCGVLGKNWVWRGAGKEQTNENA